MVKQFITIAMSYPYQIKSIDAYHAAYKKSIEEPAQFWTEIAEHFTWHKKWDTALEWNFKDPKVEWFKGCLLYTSDAADD